MLIVNLTQLLDSGASENFMPYLEDFSDYTEFKDPSLVQTANKNLKVYIHSSGTVIICHDNGLGVTQTTKLYPAYYQPQWRHRLLSIST